MEAVYRRVRAIPAGRVATYGQIAADVGFPRAARAVGRAMKGCPLGLPWHRVVNASGGISLRRNVGSMLTQRMLLHREGIGLRHGRVPLRRYRWISIPVGPPLAPARKPTAPGRPGPRARRSQP